MPTLYVTEPGARVEKEYGRLLVTDKDDFVLLAVPISQVSEVVLVGYAGVTTPAMLAMLDAGTGLTLVSRSGKMRGRLQAAEQRNLALRHKQYARSSDPKFCLEISRAIVQGKLKNSRTMMRRMLRQRRSRRSEHIQELGRLSIDRINRALSESERAEEMAALRGLEGVSSRAYFSVLRSIFRADLSFEKRTRRPPRDPANALLSLCYSMLTSAMFTACQVVGLDPYDGFYHADKYGRPALALDLVEEFRSVVADSIVMTVINNRILRPCDFEFGGMEAGRGVYLSKQALKKFLTEFNRRLNASVYHPLAGREMSYQKIFEVQARQLRKVIEGSLPRYTPFIGR